MTKGFSNEELMEMWNTMNEHTEEIRKLKEITNYVKTSEILEYLKYYASLFIEPTAEKNFILQMIQDVKTGRLEKR